MPQLDKLTFYSQIFVIFFLIFVMFILFIGVFLPKIFAIKKIRYFWLNRSNVLASNKTNLLVEDNLLNIYKSINSMYLATFDSLSVIFTNEIKISDTKANNVTSFFKKINLSVLQHMLYLYIINSRL
jgi:Plant ATP synthase F0